MAECELGCRAVVVEEGVEGKGVEAVSPMVSPAPCDPVVQTAAATAIAWLLRCQGKHPAPRTPEALSRALGHMLRVPCVLPLDVVCRLVREAAAPRASDAGDDPSGAPLRRAGDSKWKAFIKLVRSVETYTKRQRRTQHGVKYDGSQHRGCHPLPLSDAVAGWSTAVDSVRTRVGAWVATVTRGEGEPAVPLLKHRITAVLHQLGRVKVAADAASVVAALEACGAVAVTSAGSLVVAQHDKLETIGASLGCSPERRRPRSAVQPLPAARVPRQATMHRVGARRAPRRDLGPRFTARSAPRRSFKRFVGDTKRLASCSSTSFPTLLEHTADSRVARRASRSTASHSAHKLGSRGRQRTKDFEGTKLNKARAARQKRQRRSVERSSGRRAKSRGAVFRQGRD